MPSFMNIGWKCDHSDADRYTDRRHHHHHHHQRRVAGVVPTAWPQRIARLQSSTGELYSSPVESGRVRGLPGGEGGSPVGTRRTTNRQIDVTAEHHVPRNIILKPDNSLCPKTEMRWAARISPNGVRPVSICKNLNRKPYQSFRMVPVSMTLSDLYPRYSGHNSIQRQVTRLIQYFRPISRYISQTIQDSAIVTTEGE